jgi:hypothetical protein
MFANARNGLHIGSMHGHDGSPTMRMKFFMNCFSLELMAGDMLQNWSFLEQRLSVC